MILKLCLYQKTIIIKSIQLNKPSLKESFKKYSWKINLTPNILDLKQVLKAKEIIQLHSDFCKITCYHINFKSGTCLLNLNILRITIREN